MLTLGVDLSTEPKHTAACLISWPDDLVGDPTITDLRRNVTDDYIVDLANDADIVGIDSPFGWPRAWAEAVAAHRPGEPFAAVGLPSVVTRRETDTWVAAKVRIYPLSVAADRIGATAIRCAQLVHKLDMAVDRGYRMELPLVSEVYPASALVRWGLPHTLYKGRSHAAGRTALIDELVRNGLPVALSAEALDQLEISDDAVDSLLCSLIARAVALGLTDDVPHELRSAAAAEGWIRVPSAGATLGMLRGNLGRRAP